MKISLYIISVLIFAAISGRAQPAQWSDDQNALWDYVVQSWEDDVAKNGKWPADYTHKSFVTWSMKDPAPRNRTEAISWTRIQGESSTTVWYKVTPMSIVIEGDTALVMYYSDLLNEDKEGKRKRDASSIVEVLIRVGSGWKFLSSASFKSNFGSE